MLSIGLFQHQILCLVFIIIITSGLDNFPGFPFISDTKWGLVGCVCGKTMAANIPEGGNQFENF